MNRLTYHKERKFGKFFAPILAAAVLIGSLSIMMTTTFAENLFSGGNGTQETPYLLSSPEDLAKLANDVNSGTNYADTYFEMTNNIDLTDYLAEGGAGYHDGKGWVPIGSKSAPFQGFFDGQGFTVSGLWSNRPALTAGNAADADNERIGFFGAIKNANLSNLIIDIDNSNVGVTADPMPTTKLGITGSAYVAGLVADAQSGTVTNCSVTAQSDDKTAISSNRQAGSNYTHVGGLVGSCTAVISYSNASVNVTSTHKAVGGFVGFVGNAGLVSVCSASGNVSSGMGSAGGFAGRISDNGCKIENCYSTGNVAAIGGSNTGVGGFVGEFQEAYSSPIITNCYSTGSVSGMNASDVKKFGFSGYVNAGSVLAEQYGIFDSFFLQEDTVNSGLTACAIGNAGNTYYGNVQGIAEADITADTFAGWDTTIWYIAEKQFPKFIINITVTPKANQGKVFDNTAADPAALQFDIAGAPDGFVLGGVAAFDGEAKAKGNYEILQGTIDNEHNPGYNVSFTTGVIYSITGVKITVTPTAGQSKVYGEAKDIAYTSSPSMTDATFTGTLALKDGAKGAGTHEIVQGTLAITGPNADNYTLVMTTGVNYTITPKPITVTPNANQSKQFDGTTASNISYTTDGLVPGDSLTGALALENNAVDAGNHNIIQGTLTHANNPNYTIGFAATPVTYEIKPAAIVVTPVSGMGKDFDNQAVTLSGTDKYSFTVDGETKALVNGYSLNVVLGLKNDAVTIGNHEIVAKSLAVNGPRPENYTISLATTPVTYTISEVSIKVIPNANQTAVYGSNAVISYTTEPATLPDGVELSGALGISAKTVGKHAVGIGTLELTGTNAINYRLVLADGAEFEITEKPITVTPDSDQKKTYDGKTAENITYTAPDLIQGDSLTGSLKLENDAVAAGTYKIVIGTLTNPNYKITLTPDVAFTIEKKAVTVTPNAGQEKEYDKTAPENIQYTVELIGDDELTGSLALENDAVNAGVHKIVAGTLENTNYAITVAEVDYTIIPRALTVTPDAGQSKDYDGQTASEITYTADGLLEGDELTGALALENDAVEVGTHAIVIGTLANPNYDITLEAAEYQIIGKEEPNPINPDVSDPDENQDSDNQEQEIEKTGISIEWLVIAFIAMVGSVAVLAITKKSKETR